MDSNKIRESALQAIMDFLDHSSADKVKKPQGMVIDITKVEPLDKGSIAEKEENMPDDEISMIKDKAFEPSEKALEMGPDEEDCEDMPKGKLSPREFFKRK